MSSQHSNILLISNIVNMSSADISIQSRRLENVLLLQIKPISSASSAIAEFLSAILHLRSDSDILATLTPVGDSLVLNLEVSGYALNELEQSGLLLNLFVRSNFEPRYSSTPPLSSTRSQSPTSSCPSTPPDQQCYDCEERVTSGKLTAPIHFNAEVCHESTQYSNIPPPRVPSPAWLKHWDNFTTLLQSLKQKAGAMAQTRAEGLNGSATPAANGESSEAGGFKLKFCTVCASNNNRSMESHLRLAAADFPVISFGTGSLVRLPGATINTPNVYHFNKTSYDSMYKELEAKDARLYHANGILNMLGRNRSVKWGPERWQDWEVGVPRLQHSTDQGSEGVEGGVVDVVITCEERCWDAVIEDLHNRGSPLNRPVHVINVDIKDNHEEALVGGRGILDLANSLNKAATEERAINPAGFDSGSAASRSGFDARVPEILGEWQERWPNLPAVWTLAWF